MHTSFGTTLRRVARWELTDFGLTAEDFGVGQRFPLQMQFALAGADVAVEVAADMQATLVLADNAYRLDELQLLAVDRRRQRCSLAGQAGPSGTHFESLVADLTDETLELNGLTLEFLGLTMAGSLSGQRLHERPCAHRRSRHPRVRAARGCYGRFEVDVQPRTRRARAYPLAEANLLYNSSQVGLRDMRLSLDDSTLTGRVASRR